ncbi:MAG: glycoside hydrolase family 3 N-terminal domain-containing protein [Planctomycetota bacterium]
MMTTLERSAAALAVVGCAASLASAQSSQRVESLLEAMTLEEKAGQMVQVTVGTLTTSDDPHSQSTELDMAKVRELIVDKHIGSILNTFERDLTPELWRETVGTIQQVATEETRLGVPIVWGVDSVHGANYITGATIFPQNLAMAATFDPEMSYRAGEITAIETRVAGPHWNFSPVGDVGRMPVWSRFFETFGEDSFVCTVMAEQNVLGQQAAGLSTEQAVAACAKHFLGYSWPRSGRDRTPVIISEQELRDIFLPPFRSMIDAGVATIMVNSGEVNGQPIHSSHEYLVGMLRDELGFKGVAVTDWDDIGKLHGVHRVSPNEKESTYLAITAGVDMSMAPYNANYADYAVELVREGRIPAERIEQSARRILQLKEDLGLFDNPLATGSLDVIGSDEHTAVAREAARASLVMLKNDNETLPAARNTRVLVTGPAAESLPAIHGSWTYTWQGTNEDRYPDTPTILDAITSEFGESNVSFVEGSTFDTAGDLAAVSDAIGDADMVVLTLGEVPSTEIPGNISDLTLPDGQVELANAVIESGTPYVLVMAMNRPRIVTHIVDNAEAVIWMGQPGPHGPEALADILTGDLAPSGKLPFTYPRDVHALVTYDHKYTETVGADFSTGNVNYLFPFGHGLTYTAFDHAEPTVTAKRDGSGVTVEFTVSNTGDRDGTEVAMVYLTDRVASLTPPVKRLAAFQRTEIGAGETQDLRLEIPSEHFMFTGKDGRRIFEPGLFEVHVGEHTVEFNASMTATGRLIIE